MSEKEMNPFYETQMKSQVESPEDQEIWKSVFQQDFEAVVKTARTREEADSEMIRRAVIDLRKLPNGEEIVRSLLEGKEPDEALGSEKSDEPKVPGQN